MIILLLIYVFPIHLDPRKNHLSARVTIIVAVVVTVIIFFLLVIIIIAVVAAVLSAMNLRKKSVFLSLKNNSVLKHLYNNL